MATLYIVATPIGNLKDITIRALETLENVDIVASEDTRVAKKLFNAHGISTPLISYHQHNSQQRDSELLAELQQDKDIALITDAGTPLVSDPGHSLVALCRDNNIRVVPLPGACASVTALSVNDLNITRYSFEGFLPPKQSSRKQYLNELLINSRRAIILYEAKHRILELLEDVSSVFGPERRVMIARELTKMHEQIISGSVQEIVENFHNQTIPSKGEFVVIIQGDSGSTQDGLDEQNMRLLFAKVAPVMSHKDAVELAIKLSGMPKNRLYDIASEYYS